jgi:SnoaL-like domain
MSLPPEDRLAINELIALHGHLMDAGELDRLDELFAADVVYDLTDFGFGALHGIDAIRDAALALGERNPLAHHVTNVAIGDQNEQGVQVRSKGFAVNADGSSGSVVYDDVVRRVGAGWRIHYRKVTPRRKPLQP